jgi:hypothetical protein
MYVIFKVWSLHVCESPSEVRLSWPTVMYVGLTSIVSIMMVTLQNGWDLWSTCTWHPWRRQRSLAAMLEVFFLRRAGCFNGNNVWKRPKIGNFFRADRNVPMHKIKLGLWHRDLEGIHLPSFRFSLKLKKLCRFDCFVFESWETAVKSQFATSLQILYCHLDGTTNHLRKVFWNSTWQGLGGGGATAWISGCRTIAFQNYQVATFIQLSTAFHFTLCQSQVVSCIAHIRRCLP